MDLIFPLLITQFIYTKDGYEIVKFNFCPLKDWLKEVFIRRSESCVWLDRQIILVEGISK